MSELKKRLTEEFEEAIGEVLDIIPENFSENPGSVSYYDRVAGHVSHVLDLICWERGCEYEWVDRFGVECILTAEEVSGRSVSPCLCCEKEVKT